MKQIKLFLSINNPNKALKNQERDYTLHRSRHREVDHLESIENSLP